MKKRIIVTVLLLVIAVAIFAEPVQAFSFRSFARSVSRGIRSVSRSVSRAVSAARSAVSRAVSVARSAVSRAVSVARSAVSRAVSTARSAVSRAVSSARSAVSRAVSVVRSIGKSIRTNVGRAVSAARSGVSRVVSTAKSVVGKAVNNAVNFSKTFVGSLEKVLTKGYNKWKDGINKIKLWPAVTSVKAEIVPQATPAPNPTIEETKDDVVILKYNGQLYFTTKKEFKNNELPPEILNANAVELVDPQDVFNPNTGNELPDAPEIPDWLAPIAAIAGAYVAIGAYNRHIKKEETPEKSLLGAGLTYVVEEGGGWIDETLYDGKAGPALTQAWQDGKDWTVEGYEQEEIWYERSKEDNWAYQGVRFVGDGIIGIGDLLTETGKATEYGVYDKWRAQPWNPGYAFAISQGEVLQFAGGVVKFFGYIPNTIAEGSHALGYAIGRDIRTWIDPNADPLTGDERLIGLKNFGMGFVESLGDAILDNPAEFAGTVYGGPKVAKWGWNKLTEPKVVETNHFIKRSGQRGVSTQNAIDVIKNGKQYYDPKYGTSIAYDPVSQVSVAYVVENGVTKLVTVEGPGWSSLPKSRWVAK